MQSSRTHGPLRERGRDTQCAHDYRHSTTHSRITALAPCYCTLLYVLHILCTFITIRRLSGSYDLQAQTTINFSETRSATGNTLLLLLCTLVVEKKSNELEPQSRTDQSLFTSIFNIRISRLAAFAIDLWCVATGRKTVAAA